MTVASADGETKLPVMLAMVNQPQEATREKREKKSDNQGPELTKGREVEGERKGNEIGQGRERQFPPGAPDARRAGVKSCIG